MDMLREISFDEAAMDNSYDENGWAIFFSIIIVSVFLGLCYHYGFDTVSAVVFTLVCLAWVIVILMFIVCFLLLLFDFAPGRRKEQERWLKKRRRYSNQVCRQSRLKQE
jgi:hypothetical protein